MIPIIEAPEPPGHAPAPPAAGKLGAPPADGDGARPDGFEALMALLVGGSPPTLAPDPGPDRSPEAPQPAVEGAPLDSYAELAGVALLDAAADAPRVPAAPRAARALAVAAPADAGRTAAEGPATPPRPDLASAPVADAARSTRAGPETANDQRAVVPPAAGSGVAEGAPRAEAARRAQLAPPSGETTAKSEPRGVAAAPGAARQDAPPVPAARPPEHAPASEVESAAARPRPELAATVAQAAGGVREAAALDEPQAAGRSSLAAQLAETVELAATRGPRELRVQLRPPELGQITVRVIETGGGLRVAIEAAAGEVEELLQQQLPALRVDRLDVQRADLDEPGLPEREQPRGGEREAEHGRAGLGTAPAEDGPDAAAATPASNQRVDVRV